MNIQVIVRYISNKGKLTKQFPIDSDQDISELQQLIKGHFGIPVNQQIIHFFNNDHEVRVISGFPLDFYEIGYNAYLDVRRLERENMMGDDIFEKKSETEPISDQYDSDVFQRRVDYLNKLRLTPFELNVIEEVDEDEGTLEEKEISELKRKFFEITRNKKKKNIPDFIGKFKEQSKGTQFSILDNFDKVGWSGIHYAVMFNLQGLIKELLKINGGDLLGIVSNDGWSPLFLAIQQENWALFRDMLPYSEKQYLEIQTLKGSLLHQLFMYCDSDIVEDVILNFNVNPYIKNFEGISAIDHYSAEKKKKIDFLVKIRSLPDKPVGLISRVKKNSFFFGWMTRFLRLNVENKSIERYKKMEHIPFKPLESIPIRLIEDFKMSNEESVSHENKFIEFRYDGTFHLYKVGSLKELKVWEYNINKTKEWADYNYKYLSKDNKNLYKKKTEQIWRENNIDFEEYNLITEENIEKTYQMIVNSSETEKIVRYNISFKDFDIIKMIGRGAFGKVYKVIHIKTGKVFAMKMVQKERLIKNQQEKYSKIERDILISNKDKPFLLSLYFAFQTPQFIYMIIDYCPYGDLALLLAHQPNASFSEEEAKFYIIEILMAIDDLHSRDHIYRDLKPDNVLIDETGHIRLADFGLAAEGIKNNNDFARSFCGSPIYLSPEILKNKKTYKVSDYYTVGVVLYELINGEPPFYTDDINRLYGNIRRGNLTFPAGNQFSDNCKDFISKLMKNEPKARIGAKNGLEEIKEHPFFDDVDWDKVRRKEIPSPIEMEKKEETNTRRIKLKDFEYTPETEHVHFFNNFDYILDEYKKYHEEGEIEHV